MTTYQVINEPVFINKPTLIVLLVLQFINTFHLFYCLYYTEYRYAVFIPLFISVNTCIFSLFLIYTYIEKKKQRQ